MKRALVVLVALALSFVVLVFVRNRIEQDRVAAASASAAWAKLIGDDDFVTTENPEDDAGEGSDAGDACVRVLH